MIEQDKSSLERRDLIAEMIYLHLAETGERFNKYDLAKALGCEYWEITRAMPKARKIAKENGSFIPSAAPQYKFKYFIAQEGSDAVDAMLHHTSVSMGHERAEDEHYDFISQNFGSTSEADAAVIELFAKFRDLREGTKDLMGDTIKVLVKQRREDRNASGGDAA